MKFVFLFSMTMDVIWSEFAGGDRGRRGVESQAVSEAQGSQSSYQDHLNKWNIPTLSTSVISLALLSRT
jgi:hypothetical protein